MTKKLFENLNPTRKFMVRALPILSLLGLSVIFQNCSKASFGDGSVTSASAVGTEPSASPSPIPAPTTASGQGSSTTAKSTAFDWTKLSATANSGWKAVAAAATNSNFFVAVGVYIYTSHDGAATWQKTSAPAGQWVAVTASADGSHLAASEFSTGYIYTSADSGVTWTKRSASGPKAYIDMASSADGLFIIASTMQSVAQAKNAVYASHDGGVTWAEMTSLDAVLGMWLCEGLAMSADGRKIFVAANSLYASTDGGATWRTLVSPACYGGSAPNPIAVSADGLRVACTGVNNFLGVSQIYLATSADGGATWTPHLVGTTVLEGVATSADGMRIAAFTSYGSSIFSSPDAGTTWFEENSGEYAWANAAVSGDGTKIVALNTTSGAIYKASAGTGLNNDSSPTDFSWNRIVPSNWQSHWYSAAMSPTANRMFINDASFGIFNTSMDGINWNRFALDVKYRNGQNAAISSDGLKIAMTTFANGILTSADGGVTWNSHPEAGGGQWRNIVCSTDGSRIVASGSDGFYVSSNSGATWTTITKFATVGGNTGNRLAASANAMILATVDANSGNVFTSLDGGMTWNMKGNVGIMGVISSSADGSILVAANLGVFHRSTDGGSTWSNLPVISTEGSVTNLDSIALSGDGKKIVVADQNFGMIYTSSDNGETWVTQTGAGGHVWNAVNISADGKKLLAVGVAGEIYMGSAN